MEKITFKYADGSYITATTDKTIEEIVNMLKESQFINYDSISKKYTIINLNKVKTIEVE